MGYANPVKKLDFPELAAEGDSIWVVIKNPLILPPSFLTGAVEDVEVDGDGKPVNVSAAKAMEKGRQTAAKLIIAWRVYDASVFPRIDPQTGEVVPGTEPLLLPGPPAGDGVDPALFEKVPSAITLGIMREVSAALNPQPAREGANTQNESSSPQSPSTTAPGVAAQ